MILGITKKEQEIIENILKKYQNSYSFYYYGSRVKGYFEKTSDLDILIKGEEEMPLSLLADIKEKFDKSLLPYIVNFADYNVIDKLFYERIKSTLVPITEKV